MTKILHEREVAKAVGNGMRLRCPACGCGHMFQAFLKVNDRCPECGEALHHQRADDAPPYVTIFIVGHLIVVPLVWMNTTFDPPVWLEVGFWMTVTAGLSLAILPVVKGGLVGLQWGLRMHGFSGEGGPR
jgi:uncharacterized protein (DUF983 family)